MERGRPLWKSDAGQMVERDKWRARGVLAAGFSPDGTLIASASADQTVKLWNTDTWKEKVTFSGHNDEVWSVAFSSDGKRLVSSGKDGYVCVWPASGRPQDAGSPGLPGGTSGPEVAAPGKSVDESWGRSTRIRSLP